jgi:hypothetical protein
MDRMRFYCCWFPVLFSALARSFERCAEVSGRTHAGTERAAYGEAPELTRAADDLCAATLCRVRRSGGTVPRTPNGSAAQIAVTRLVLRKMKLPLDAINAACTRERPICDRHPITLSFRGRGAYWREQEVTFRTHGGRSVQLAGAVVHVCA